MVNLMFVILRKLRQNRSAVDRLSSSSYELFLNVLIVDYCPLPGIGGVNHGATTSADLSTLFDAGGIIGMQHLPDCTSLAIKIIFFVLIEGWKPSYFTTASKMFSGWHHVCLSCQKIFFN